MPQSIPPLQTLSIAAIQQYDAGLEKRMQAAEAAGDTSMAEFDEDVLNDDKDLILWREGYETQSQFEAQNSFYYKDEMRLVQLDPNASSNV